MGDEKDRSSLESPEGTSERRREGSNDSDAVASPSFGRAISSVRTHPHRYAVGAITLAFAVTYAIAGLIEHMGHRTALLDLGIYDQAVREYAKFNLPRVPLFGVRTPEDPGLLHWSDHFTPIVALLTPLYWFHDGPESLIVVQAVLFTLAIPPIWLFTRRALGPVAAYFVAVAFGLSWPIQEAAWIPFHQVAFAVPLMALMLERYQGAKYEHAALCALLLLTVREDLGLLVSTFGILLLAKGERRLGGALAAGGILATFVITNLLIPLFGGSPRRNWSYPDFGRNPVDMLEIIVRSPLATLEYALTPAPKVHTLIWLFAPLLFLCLRSKLVLLALPLLAIRFLSSEPNYWSTKYHYNAFVIPILFCAAVDGARALPRFEAAWLRRPFATSTLWAAAVCSIAVITLPRWPLWMMTQRSWWHPRTASVQAAERALARIPDGVFVAAVNNVGIHLTHRAKVILWVPPGDRREVEAVWKLEGLRWKYVGDRKLAEPEWVLADIQRQQFPFRSLEAQRDAVRSLLDRGYNVVNEVDGYVLLVHSGTTPPPATAPDLSERATLSRGQALTGRSPEAS